MESEKDPLDSGLKTIIVHPHQTEPGPQDAGTAPQAWELLARFRSTQALDDAIRALEASGFGRDDLGLPEINPPPERASPEAGSKAADTDVEAQQSRVFHSAVGGSFAAMMGATAVAATGGIAAAVAGVALGTGAAVAGVASLLSSSLSHSEQQTRERKAREGTLVLAVLAKSDERRDRAVAILQEAGGELLN
ncbi:MAG TPA: hypothetical protein VJ779_02650 [Acetobacteraceae bacterium]|jgi:hypothetical protein|nr:hypothetical protein [Acetobacteraceae bacterium]